MKISKLKTRLQRPRPMAVITMRLPNDVITDLKRVAQHRGFTYYQPLIRAYVGQGLREDLALPEGQPEITELISSLRKQGVREAALKTAMRETGLKRE